MSASQLSGSIGGPPRTVVARYCIPVTASAPHYTFNLNGLSLGRTYHMRVVYEEGASKGGGRWGDSWRVAHDQLRALDWGQR